MSSIGGGGINVQGSQVTLGSTPSSAEAVMSQIDGACASLTALCKDLEGLVAQLQAESQQLSDLLQSKPQDPGSKADDKAKAAFQKALSEWQAKVDSLQSHIAQLKGDIGRKKKDIKEGQEQLTTLQNTVLPQARERDRAALEAQIPAAQDAAERALQNAAPRPSGADSIEAADASSAQRKKLLQGQAPLGGTGLPVNEPGSVT